MAKKKDYNYTSEGKGKLTEYNSAFDNKTVNYDVEKGLVKSDPLIDDGTGIPVLMRTYEFIFPPTIKRRPTKAEILTKGYTDHLKIKLWAEGLELIREPRCVIKQDRFYVFATCTPKRGSQILDDIRMARVKTNTLQEITNGSTKNT